MSYTSAVLALDGLAAFWPLDEPSASATASDLGPHALGLTYEASTGSASGPSICKGLARSFAGDGATQWAQCAVAPSSPLAPTQAFTVGGWFQATETPAAGTRLLWRGSANWGLSISPSLQVAGPTSITGATSVGVSNAYPCSYGPVDATNPYFLVLSWDGLELTLWVDGLKEQTIRGFGGSIIPTSDPFQLFNGGGNPTVFAKALASGVFVVGRGITAGECMDLFVQGTLTKPPTEAIAFDFQYSSNPVVAASPVSARCASCGGERRADEATVKTADGIEHHVGCYGARQSAKSIVSVTPGVTPTNSSGEVAKFLWAYITWCTRRTSPTDLLYLDPQTLLPAAFIEPGVPMPGSNPFASYAGIATAAAMLVRYGDVPTSSWLLEVIKAIHKGAIAQQSPAGDYDTNLYGTPGQFYPVELAQTIALLGDKLDIETRAGWVKSLLSYMNNNYLATYFPYYANGNIELQNLLLVWLTGYITGDERWQTQYERQYQLLVDPAVTQAAYPTQDVNAAGNGLVYSRKPTDRTGQNGAGYFVESGASSEIASISATNPAVVTLSSPLQGICPDMSCHTNTVLIMNGPPDFNKSWKPTVLSATSLSIPYDNSGGPAFRGNGAIAQAQGFDPDYTSYQANVASRLWVYNRDPAILRLMNLLYNQVAPLCSDEYVYNATNGTRHSLTETFSCAVMQTLAYVAGRSLPADAVAAQWNVTYRSYFQSAFTGSNQTYWRNIEYEMGGFLMCAADWPDLTARPDGGS
jgi:hypothetical protein